MGRGECGRLPLCTTYYINCIRYWCNFPFISFLLFLLFFSFLLLTMPLHRHPKQCYNMLKSLDDAGRICWATEIRTLLYKYGFSFIWISQDVGDNNAFIRMFKHRVVNYCTLDWQAALDTYSKCDHYNNFKSLLTVETYLTIYIQLKYRIAMSKFCLSNQRLNIELGRYNIVLKKIVFVTFVNSYIIQL